MAAAPPGPIAADDEWRERARAFARSALAPLAGTIDVTDRVPDGVRAELARAGLMGLGIPSEFGGAGGSRRALAAVLEEVAAENAAVATLLSVHLSVAAAPIVRWGTAGQREKWLPRLARGDALGAFALSEPGVGSDAAHLTMKYRRDDSGFVLTGTKMFITNAASSDLVLAFATRDPSAGHRGISAFLVPGNAPGLTVAQRLDKLGIRGSETTELVFDDVRLGTDDLLGEEGGGLGVALGALTGGRIGIAACALGVARAAFEEMREAARRAPTDAKRSVVAQSFVRVEAARALIERAADLQESGAPFAEAASAAKLAASEAAVWVAGRGLEVAGLEGARSGARAERLFRDARVFPIVEGTTEVQELILGRSLVGREGSG